VADLVDGLWRLTDEHCDDVRLYRLPERCMTWLSGDRAVFPGGVRLDASDAAGTWFSALPGARPRAHRDMPLESVPRLPRRRTDAPSRAWQPP